MISVKEAISSKDTSVIIDVRSPSEFEKGRILDSVNIPLLDDEERAIVGTLYKKKGFRPAFLEGLRLVGPKLPEFASKGIKLSKDKNIILYCWRGSMRSNSMKWLFESAKIEGVEVIEGGYKNYRRFLRENYEEAKLLVLGGYTGSGKTDVLKCMKDKTQVIDLEGLANHKGSAFGFIGEDPQPSTEHFENMLGEELFNLDMSKDIWVEDESRNIGRIYLPEQLYNKLRTSPVIFLDIPKDIRIERLVKEYSNYGNDVLEKALNSIVKRIGGNNYKDAIAALNKNDYHTVADITLNYYDKAYAYGVEKREQKSVYKLKIDSGDPEIISRKILAYIDTV